MFAPDCKRDVVPDLGVMADEAASVEHDMAADSRVRTDDDGGADDRAFAEHCGRRDVCGRIQENRGEAKAMFGCLIREDTALSRPDAADRLVLLARAC